MSNFEPSARGSPNVWKLGWTRRGRGQVYGLAWNVDAATCKFHYFLLPQARSLQLPLSIDGLESWQMDLLHFSQPQALRISWKHAHDCWWATTRDRQFDTPTNFVSGRQLCNHQELCWCVTPWSASCRKYLTFRILHFDTSFYLSIPLLTFVTQLWAVYCLSHISSLMGYMGILIQLP